MKVIETDGFKEDMKRLFSNEPKYLLRRWWDFISRDMWQNIKWFFQRGFRGYSDSDCWGVDWYLSKIVPRMLEQMIDKKKSGDNSYPGYGVGGRTSKEWHETVNKIIDGFDSYYKLSEGIMDWTSPRGKKLADKYKEGMRLFIKWFPHLWD